MVDIYANLIYTKVEPKSMKNKRQVSFYVDDKLWRELSKKAIDLNKAKSEILEQLISQFVRK